VDIGSTESIEIEQHPIKAQRGKPNKNKNIQQNRFLYKQHSWQIENEVG